MTADPLVAAIAQLLARHHTSTNQPVTPAPWMTAAAAELVEQLRPYVDTWERQELATTIETTP